MEPSPSSKVWINYLPNVSLGNILSILSFCGLIIAGWNAFDKRLSLVEERQSVATQQITEVRKDSAEIKATLQKIDNQLQVQQFQLNTLQPSPRK